MPKHLEMAEHLPADEVERRYRGATDPVARSQWQILWLLAGGQSTAQVAVLTGYCVDWMRVIAQRYHQAGSSGVGDRRPHNPGAKRLLTAEQEVDQALEGPAPDGGEWPGRSVARWMSGRVGRPLDPARGWEARRRLGFTSGRVRAQADLAGLQKGGLAEQVSPVQRACPAAQVSVWGTDQHRIGLTPILPRVW